MYKLPFQSQQNISIQQQLGEAFQDVKAVRDNLDNVVAVLTIDQDDLKAVGQIAPNVIAVGDNIDSVLRVDANRDNLASIVNNEANVNTVAVNMDAVIRVVDRADEVGDISGLLVDTDNLSQTVRELIEFGTEQYMFIDVALGDRLTYGPLFNEADAYNVLLGKVYDGTATPEEALAVEELNQKLGFISAFEG
jgi:hypothetical protein